MDLADNLITGFAVAFQPHNLFFCFVGVLIGTLIGVLPGIGPVGAMSILLPITFGISPVTAIIMLSGIYYGAQYGGSTTSILVGIPGEAASVVTMYPHVYRQLSYDPFTDLTAVSSVAATGFGRE